MSVPLRELAVGAALVTVLAVPAVVAVTAEPPARFGFQMYSGYGVATATWTDTEGVAHRVDLEEHLASARREVDWTTSLPRRLCPRLPGALSVEVRQTARGGDRVGRATC